MCFTIIQIIMPITFSEFVLILVLPGHYISCFFPFGHNGVSVYFSFNYTLYKNIFFYWSIAGVFKANFTIIKELGWIWNCFGTSRVFAKHSLFLPSATCICIFEFACVTLACPFAPNFIRSSQGFSIGLMTSHVRHKSTNMVVKRRYGCRRSLRWGKFRTNWWTNKWYSLQKHP